MRFPASGSAPRAAAGAGHCSQKPAAPDDLPLFIAEGQGAEEPIASLPGVSRWSVDRLGAMAREARDLGIPCVALFPNTPRELRTEDAREALNPDNLICRAVRAVKDSAPEIGVLTDVALDPYTAHGHDGLVDGAGCVINDSTMAMLVEQALVQAAAGADLVAPSDMMDGRVGAIRAALEREGMSTSRSWPIRPNIASASMGRSVVCGRLARAAKGDKKCYQMDRANAEEALGEVAPRSGRGADSVMVKPACPISTSSAGEGAFRSSGLRLSGVGRICDDRGRCRGRSRRPRRARAGDFDGVQTGGCSGVLTYHAPVAARLLGA